MNTVGVLSQLDDAGSDKRFFAGHVFEIGNDSRKTFGVATKSIVDESTFAK